MPLGLTPFAIIFLVLIYLHNRPTNVNASLHLARFHLSVFCCVSSLTWAAMRHVRCQIVHNLSLLTHGVFYTWVTKTPDRMLAYTSNDKHCIANYVFLNNGDKKSTSKVLREKKTATTIAAQCARIATFGLGNVFTAVGLFYFIYFIYLNINGKGHNTPLTCR